MQTSFTRPATILARLAEPRFLVFILGKLCLIAAVGFSLQSGLAFRKMKTTGIASAPIDLTSVEGETKKTVPLEAYAVISTRNMFGKETTAPAPQPSSAPSQLKLRLVGTSVTAGSEPFAIIEDEGKKDQDIFGLNEQVFGQAKLVEILPESVRVDFRGKMETLLIEDGEPAPGGEEPVVSDDQTEFTVAETEVTDALGNLPKLLSEARAVPYFRNGQSVGMRLFAIRRGSLYERLGLKNGDIIKEVNNQMVGDPTQAIRLFEQLKSERSISVKLERNGEQKSLSYSVK
jgi:general secretion pathway protein C